LGMSAMTFQKSLCRWLPLLHRCVTLVKHFFKKLGEITMTKILIDELKRIRSIIYNAAGQSPDDEESLTEAYKSINRLIEQPAQQEPHDPIGDAQDKLIAEQALDKKADNARDLGLDYMEGSAEQYEKELEQAPAQEPVAWMYEGDAEFDGNDWRCPTRVTISKQVAENSGGDVCPLYTTPPAPAGYAKKIESLIAERDALKAELAEHAAQIMVDYIYTTPPAPAQPLTDEQIQKLRHNIDWTASWSYIDFARAIEAAHGITGEKNG
jgi:hypothetical protein